MTGYKRIRDAINHRMPDRVPCDFSAEPGVWRRLMNYFEVDSREAILDILQIDRRVVGPTYIGPELKQFEDGSYETIVSGGPIMKSIPSPIGGTSESIVRFPWADIEEATQLEGRWGWNGDIKWWDFSSIPKQIEALEEKGEYWISAHGDPSGLQHLCMWAGDEKFLMTLALDEELAVAMIEKHNQFRLEHALKTLEAGGGKIHELNGGGDYGSQNGLLISKEMFRRYFKPLYINFYNEIKKNFDVEIFFHSCGAIMDLIPDFIEMGVTILDPIQVSAENMKIDNLKQQFGQQVTFHGAIDIQKMLPYETEEVVRKEVRKVIEVLGANGGYILSPTHMIQEDTPINNILAVYEEVQKRKIIK